MKKYKNLNSTTTEHVTIQTQLIYNLNNDNFGVYTSFYKAPGNYGGSKTNKNCAHWLGCKAEVVLMSMFNNVQRMPFKNPGYDFKCGLGYLVDAKSACLGKNLNSNRWMFRINKNKIANYFLCLAFDNRDDMNPLHVWLIPGRVINNFMSVSISKSTVNKWSEYEQSIDKVLLCCNEMKHDNKKRNKHE